MLIIKVPIVVSFGVVPLVTKLCNMARTTGCEIFVISFAYNGLAKPIDFKFFI